MWTEALPEDTAMRFFNTEAPRPPVGLLLAAGESRRFGTDKRLQLLADGWLIALGDQQRACLWPTNPVWVRLTSGL
ncbi:MAG: hypothetical protein C1943_13425 [Halochromatium sp.]|nr:hypothetical protein [Halochromatium sp.]